MCKKELVSWAEKFSSAPFRRQHCAKFFENWISALQIIDSLKLGKYVQIDNQNAL